MMRRMGSLCGDVQPVWRGGAEVECECFGGGSAGVWRLRIRRWRVERPTFRKPGDAAYVCGV